MSEEQEEKLPLLPIQSSSSFSLDLSSSSFSSSSSSSSSPSTYPLLKAIPGSPREEIAASYNNLTSSAIKLPKKKQNNYGPVCEITNTITFPPNNKAQYVVTKQECDINDFIENHLFGGELRLDTKPQAIIYVIGGAKYFEVDSTLDSVIRRGIIKAASKLNAWIIDGGMNAGVMKYIGKCIKTMSIEPIKCIGVATLGKSNHHEQLKKLGSFEYTTLPNTQRHQDLDPNHTHFILVDSDKPQSWGEEVPFLDKFLNTLNRDHGIPVVSVAINGGYTALDVIANSITDEFPTILVDGTGRACDAVSQLVRVAKKYKIAPEDANLKKIVTTAVGNELDSWNKLLVEMNKGGHDRETDEHTKPVVDRILQQYDKLTFFDPYEEGYGLDSVIYNCLLTKIPPTVSTDDPVAHKLLNLIQWTDRADLVTDIVINEIHKVKTTPAIVLADALAFALTKNRQQIFATLCDFNASFNKPLSYLYKEIDLSGVNERRSLMSHDAFVVPYVTDRVTSNNECFERVMDIISNVGPVSTIYANLCSQYYAKEMDEDEKMSSLVDLLVWAVFKKFHKLARVIWKRTRYPIHSALLVCNLYKHLAKSEFNPETFLGYADWYEIEAVKILNSVEYTLAKKLIKFSSSRMLGKATLEDLALEGNCKSVMAHPYMQRYFDEMLYSYKGSNVIAKPNRSNIQLVLLIVSFFIPFYRQLTCTDKKLSEKQNPAKQMPKKQNTEKQKQHRYSGRNPEDSFVIFFNVPIVKLWTNTMFYLGFLILQAFVLLNFKERTIKPEEYILWVWVASMIMEELMEIFNKHGKGYFYQFTNQIDVGLLVLHLVYIVLRLIQVHVTLDATHWSAAVNCLLLASVLSWLRLMCAFFVSQTFGPLFFILIRLMGDLVKWFAVFSIFAISFQIAFASLAIQAGVDPRITYPNANGSFPISLVTVVGEWSYLADVMSETPTGVFYLAIYAFIVNVMFVNLLIAMMGSTYSSLVGSSDVEWNHYRCGFVRDSMTTSAFPPPINIIELFLNLFRLYKKVGKKTIKNQLKAMLGREKISERKEIAKMDKTSKVMRVSLDILREEDEFNESQSPLVQIKTLKRETEDIRNVLNQHQNLMTNIMATVTNTNQSIDKIISTVTNTNQSIEVIMKRLDAITASS